MLTAKGAPVPHILPAHRSRDGSHHIHIANSVGLRAIAQHESVSQRRHEHRLHILQIGSGMPLDDCTCFGGEHQRLAAPGPSTEPYVVTNRLDGTWGIGSGGTGHAYRQLHSFLGNG